MKGNELVWRTLVDRAFAGQRRWKNASEIADEAGVPARTAYLALEKPREIGAVEQRSPGGIAVTNPEKLVTLLAAWRSLARDTLRSTTLDAVQEILNTMRNPYAIGGADAAVHYLDSWNNIADIGTRLVYVPAWADLDGLPAGDEVIVLSMDKRAERNWDTGFTSLAQTYADLFALPGWQAEEFRRALWFRHFQSPDWDQKEIAGG